VCVYGGKCVCVCVCACVYGGKYVCACVYVHVHTCARVRTCTQLGVSTHMQESRPVCTRRRTLLCTLCNTPSDTAQRLRTHHTGSRSSWDSVSAEEKRPHPYHIPHRCSAVEQRRGVVRRVPHSPEHGDGSSGAVSTEERERESEDHAVWCVWEGMREELVGGCERFRKRKREGLARMCLRL
jgi:hypothetical protein